VPAPAVVGYRFGLRVQRLLQLAAEAKPAQQVDQAVAANRHQPTRVFDKRLTCEPSEALQGRQASVLREVEHVALAHEPAREPLAEIRFIGNLRTDGA
jgi:hypothetical protein